MVNDTQAERVQETVYETVRGAVAGDDAPMESGHKIATAALVAATYPIVLIVLVIVGLAVAYITSRPTDDVTGTSIPIPAAEAAR